MEAGGGKLGGYGEGEGTGQQAALPRTEQYLALIVCIGPRVVGVLGDVFTYIFVCFVTEASGANSGSPVLYPRAPL